MRNRFGFRNLTLLALIAFVCFSSGFSCVQTPSPSPLPTPSAIPVSVAVLGPGGVS